MADLFKTADLFGPILPPPCGTARDLRWHYGDVAEMDIPEHKPSTAWHSEAWSDDGDNRGTSTMSGALALARDGWAEGAEIARKLREGFTATLPTRNKLARYDVAGAVPSVARALAGNPLNMRRMVRSDTRTMPTLTLVCDISVNWDFPASAMIEHAAASAATVDLLEDAGFRCELIVVARTANIGISGEIAVRLKAPEAPANMSAVAFGLGHASLFRRMMFATWGLDRDAEPLGYSLGSARTTKAERGSGTFTIPSARNVGGEHASPMQRFRLICDALRSQECPGIPDADDMPKEPTP